MSGKRKETGMPKYFLLSVLLVFLLSVFAIGCATGARGPSDEEQIASLLNTWKEGILAKDVEKIMTTYSEKFAHDGYEYEAKDKAALREYIEWSIEEGNFEGVEVDLSGAEISIEDGSATIYPIDYANWQGSITIELSAAKEKGRWLFTDMALEGL
ncbi:MAG: hypothetical protein R6V12_08700 [Candidatus Hydrogenedentota bacterium]